MKVLSRHVERDGSGSVTVNPEEDEDMYHLYNLIEVGDLVRGPTVRRIQSESSTGSIESQRVRITLTIQVAKSSFDATGSSAPLDPGAHRDASAVAVSDGSEAPKASKSSSVAGTGNGHGALGGGSGGDGATLHISGRVVSENKHVKMGAFHTLDLEVNRQLTITKDAWDSIHFERLSDSSDVGKRAEVGALVLGDGEYTDSVMLGWARGDQVRQETDRKKTCEEPATTMKELLEAKGKEEARDTALRIYATTKNRAVFPGNGATYYVTDGAFVLAGTATVCLLTEHMTVIRQRIDVPLPRKHKSLSSSSTEKSQARFLSLVYQAVLKLLQLPALRLIILASPGFTRETVYDFLFAEATRQGEKALAGHEARQKFLRIHCNSPHIHSLMEVLRSSEVSNQLKDTRFAKEGQLLNRFQRMLASDELRAWYGERHVTLAAQRGAIQSLLISDGLFRAADPMRRKKFVRLVEDVRSAGGEALIFSGMHESGRQLNDLTGIAAILRFPLDVEVVEEEEREEQETQIVHPTVLT